MERYKKTDSVSYTFGTTLTFELLKKKPEQALRVYLSPKQARDETYDELARLCHEAKIPLIENNLKIFKELSEKDNTMAIGEFSKFACPLDPAADHVVLVNPSNMGNLGTIMRTCAGFGLVDLALIRPAADVFDPKTVRASMGALFNLRFEYFDSFEDYLKRAGKRALYPFMLQAKLALRDVVAEAPYSLIFGNEATGLDESYLRLGTPLIIPHSDLIDSLNLDNAVSIAVYKFTESSQGKRR